MKSIDAIPKWPIVLTTVISSLALTLDAGSVAISFPKLADTFQVDTSTILWVGIIYMLTIAGLLFTMGWVGDVAGRRVIYVSSFAVFAFGLLISSVAPNLLVLLLGRVVQGIGAAMAQANEYAILAQVFSPRERPRAVGFLGIGVGMGLGLGPVLGGLVLDHMDWRAMFYLRIPLSIVGFALAWRVVTNEIRDATAKRPRPDFIGALLLFVTVGGFLLAVNQFGRTGLHSPLFWVSAVTFLALAPVFFKVERKVPHPILDFSLFGTTAFRMAVLSAIGFYMARNSLDYLAPFYLQRGLGYSASTAGLFLFSFHILRMIGSPISGAIGAWLTARTISSVSLLTMAIGIVVISQLGLSPPVWAIVFGLVLAGLGAAAFEPPNTAAILDTSPPDRRGSGSAAVASARLVGQSTGAAIAGALFSARHTSYQNDLTAQGITAADANHTATALAFGDAILLILICAILGFLASVTRPGGWKRPAIEHTEEMGQKTKSISSTPES